MASFVPGYEHEVFVSYATVDDRPAKSGWVSAFVNSLSESLAAAVGRRDPERIWWDRSAIDEEAHLTEQIRSKVQKSACMIVILSRGYCQSNWCGQEREAFLAAIAGQPEAERRLFVIDIGNLELEDRPSEFRDKRGRVFYAQPPNTTSLAVRETLGFPIPDPANHQHKPFYAQIEQLAKDICDRLRKMPGVNGTPSPQKTHPDVTVYVAESADDVVDEREEVVRFLSDHFQVLPALDEPLPSSFEQWQTSVDAALQASTLFVQILGTLPGRKIIGSDQKLVIAQFERARSTGKRILTWRKAAPEHVTDRRMKELVTAAEYSGPLEQFKTEVQRIALPPAAVKVVTRPGYAGDQPPPMIFIHAGIEDQNQAELLSNALTELDCFTSTPLVAGPPDRIREDLEANLIECDGLILFYGRINADWLRSQFRALPRSLSKRQSLVPPRPLRALAICNGEPPNKPRPGINAPDLQWIDLSTPDHRQLLESWVARIRNGGER